MKTIPLQLWRERIQRHGLGNLVDLGLDVLEPLSPFVGQALWVMQPTLGLFTNREGIGAWAELLEDPQGVEWLREQLLEPERDKP